MTLAAPLPVHGFVLAGGKSSRMGRDKALLPFGGRPMVEIAVEKLRSFCAQVSVAGNRDDLKVYGPVVTEARQNAGPVAGLEAGLREAAWPWVLFVPVDVPLVPAPLLAAWAAAVLEREVEGIRLSLLRANGERQPAFCLLHRSCAHALTAAVDEGTLKLVEVFDQVASQVGGGSMWVAEAETFAPKAAEAERTEAGGPDTEACFANVNTPEDLAALELWTRHLSPQQ